MGLINAGTAVGSVLAPPLIGVVLLLSGWRIGLLLSQARVGLVWVLWWALSYRGNTATVSSRKRLDARARSAAVDRFGESSCAAQRAGARLRQVHERFRLVLPALLAAQVSL